MSARFSSLLSLRRGSMRWLARGSACLLACSSLACSSTGPAPSDPASSGAPAPLSVSRSVVRELEQARGLPTEQAEALAIEDLLLAEQLSHDAPELARLVERVALAQALARQLYRDADAEGPPTDAELTQLTRQRWWEFERPRMVQVVHAVVLSEAENVEARALAERIGKATERATSAPEFETAARAVVTGEFSVKVERLPPVTLDGRAIDPEKPPPAGPPEQQFAAEFAVAAHKLERVGEHSTVVRSPFGYHVMFAVRIVEPRQPSLEELRGRLRPEVSQRRALRVHGELLARSRAELAPEKARAALRLMAQVSVGP
jgi:hypothetical protein